METEPTKAEPPKRRRRWFQFSLRALLVFTLICAIPCAWLGRRIERKRQELAAVEAIRKSGGEVGYAGYDYGEEPSGPAWLRTLLGENFFDEIVTADIATDDAMANAKMFTQIRHITLADTVTGAGLPNLEGLPKLEILEWKGRVTDVCLANLKGLSQLRRLFLGGTLVTGSGLSNLKGLTNLVQLNLTDSGVGDPGLENLEGLQQLKFLDLRGTQVTDAGLTAFKGMSNLKSLSLEGTRVTDDGVAELHRALPNCQISRLTTSIRR